MKSVSSRNVSAQSKAWKLIGFVSFLIFIVQIPSSEEAGKMFSDFASIIVIKGFELNLIVPYHKYIIFANIIRI